MRQSRRVPGRFFPAVLFMSILTAMSADPSGAAERRITLDDLETMVSVSDPEFAPNGRSIVVVVTRPDFEENRYDHELVLVDIESGDRRVLTHDRKIPNHPRWSPSGDRLAFLAMHGEGEKAGMQIYMMPMNGGDAKRVTDAPDGVQQFTWRPDGREIAFVAADAPPQKDEDDKTSEHLDAFEVGPDHYLTTEAPLPAHIWLVSPEGGDARRLTSGDWSLPVVLPPGSPSSPVSWSPDGREIAFVRQESPHFGDWAHTRAEVIAVASGRIRPLTGEQRFETFPTHSPDGSQIAYWWWRDGDPNNVSDIYVAPAAGGKGRNLTRPIDRCLYQSLWMPDGKSLLVGGNDGDSVSLWIQPLEGKARRLPLGDLHPSWSFWIDAAVGPDGSIAFTGSSPDRPTELYYMATPDTAPRRLTDFNGAIARLNLGRVESIEWDGPDGFHENGMLFYPPGFKARRKYPLVLLIHGGPQAASTRSFDRLAQLMAARGYVVFEPNYRGSDNLGNEYQRAIFGDAGEGPGRDVMAGLEAVKAKGFVDESRIAVSGWSYGGYMTTWLIGQYHVWKTAIAGAAVTDLIDEYSLSDFNASARYFYGGSPWVDGFDAKLREQSPITYAGQVRTPTLILANTGDPRVPTSQSYKFYHALRDNGVPVTFVAWPVAGHFPRDPVRARDVYGRWLDWLDRYLK